MGDPGRFPVHHAELEPQRPSSCGDRLSCVRNTQLGAPEDVDHVERAGRSHGFSERAMGRDAEDVSLVRIDRHALEALLDQVAEDGVRRSPAIRGRPDDRDPPGRPEQTRDPGVIEYRDRTSTLLEIHERGGAVALLARQRAAQPGPGSVP